MYAVKQIGAAEWQLGRGTWESPSVGRPVDEGVERRSIAKRRRTASAFEAAAHDLLNDGIAYLKKACCKPGHIRANDLPLSARAVLLLGKIKLSDKLPNERIEAMAYEVFGWDRFDWGDDQEPLELVGNVRKTKEAK